LDISSTELPSELSLDVLALQSRSADVFNKDERPTYASDIATISLRVIVSVSKVEGGLRQFDRQQYGDLL
jgi:hypothetical protein